MAREFKYEIEEKLGYLSGDEESTYSKQFNFIKYGKAEPKYDIRNWTVEEDGSLTMGKGITLDEEELKKLYFCLQSVANDKNW